MLERTRRTKLNSVFACAASTLIMLSVFDSKAKADDDSHESQREVLTLEQAIARAMSRNPSVQIAREEVARSNALIVQARAASFPTVTAGATYTRLDADRRLGDRLVAGADALSANVTVAIPIVAPKAWAQWSHSKDSARIVQAAEADVRRQIAIATARAYLAVLAQNRVIEAVERSLRTATSHYDFSHTRRLGGVGNQLDEVRAAQEVASVDAQVAASHVGLARAREALGVLVGSNGAVDAASEPVLDSKARSATLFNDVRRRADVRVFDARVRATENIARDQWVDYSPYLTGILQPFYQNPPSLVQPLTGWQAQLILQIPLYDGGLRYGAQREREALASEARATLEGTLRQARADIRTAFEAMRLSDRALASQRQAAKLAAESLELANLAYRAGATTNLEVIDAERRARDAETLVVVAEDSARQARLDLLVASGRFVP